MKLHHLYAVLVALSSAQVSAQDLSAWPNFQEIGPIEYTAEFVQNPELGRAVLQLSPASEAASIIDGFARNGFQQAYGQTAEFITSWSRIEDQDVMRTSRGLVFEAWSRSVQMSSVEWEQAGLAIGYAPFGATPDVPVLAFESLPDGTAFVATGDGSAAGNVVLADYSVATVAGLSVARMREIAREAAEEMFSSAAQSACASRPRPSQITPSIAVSFNLLAGAEFSISAVYEVAELCAALEDGNDQ